MDMYVLFVRGGYEESAAEAIRKLGYKAMCPIRKLHIRKGGKWCISEDILFPQYVFIECELTDEVYYELKRITGYIRLLGVGEPQKLTESEAAYIRLLYNNGEPIEASTVYVSSTGEKMILSGVLRNCIHSIISLDLRQRRARIAVDILGVRRKLTLPAVEV